MADPIEWSIITTDCFDEWFGQQDESTQNVSWLV